MNNYIIHSVIRREILEEKKQRLFDAARLLFMEDGFKKTNVAGITKKAGVAVGSFYRFYDSKEDIFIQIYKVENENTKHQILKNVNFDEEPHKLIHQVLKAIFVQSSDNRILKVWFDESSINEVISKQINLEQGFAYITFTKLIDHWNEEDMIKPGMTKKRIMAMFSVISVVDIHQNEIQTDNYFQTISDMLDSFLLLILK